MVISYCIWVFSILTLLKFSDFTEINNTVEANDGNTIQNSINKNGNISGLHTDLIDEMTLHPNLTVIKDLALENDSLVHQSNNPGTPIPYNNISNEHKTTVTNGDSMDKVNGTAMETGASTESTKPMNITDSNAGNDEMPTFVVYRQKMEKESKEKKEKADSIPSSPTMIVKDDNKPVKPQSESANSKSSSARDSTDQAGNVAPVAQDTKTHTNVEKVDSKSGGGGGGGAGAGGSASSGGSGADEIKADARAATLTKKLLKNNVAAKECGAKMLEVSQQMTNADHVLNSNKDEYLNVPCSLPDKWFVVEACEPVQIRSIQIANFEMFSSRPKTFKVFSSDRYPVKHWYNLGLFRALDEKGIQTFAISDSNMVKYIKFEMVDHHGSEHYCPLTFVRILGNVVIDEMDEDSEDAQSSGDDDSSIDNLSESILESNSDGILTKAKDMLVKMVNGIGGAKKPDSDQAASTELSNNTVQANGEVSRAGLIEEESPCYFIDFLAAEVLANCETTISRFQRFLNWDRLFQYRSNYGDEGFDSRVESLEARIVAEPYPLQIRVDYFSVSRSVNGSRFEFGRLHRSYRNLTAMLSRDLCMQRPWLGFGALFKCCSSRSRWRQSRCALPNLPNVTSPAPLDTGTSSQRDLSAVPSSSVEPPDLGLDSSSSMATKSTKPAVTGANENEQIIGETDSKVTQSNDTAREESITNLHSNSDGISKESRVNRTVLKEFESEMGTPPDGLGSGEIPQSGKIGATGNGGGGNSGGGGVGSNAWNQAFMRIKNTARQLELNVSISMQYLEELSQNYKVQTERLKRAQQQTAEELGALEHAVLQHRRDARDAIARLARQLQGLALKLRFGFSTAAAQHQSFAPPSNASADPDPSELPELRCSDLLAADELFMPSWTDSPWFLVLVSTAVSVVCNMLLLALLYKRARLPGAPAPPAIAPSVSSTASSTTGHKSDIDHRTLEFSFIEELSHNSPSRSCGDLSKATVLSPYPVVLPPRGVNLSFVKDEMRRRSTQFQPQLGPHFYTVLPSLNFVTPSKDRKKKRKK